MFPYIMLMNWVSLIAHSTISGIYIWKIIEVNLSLDIYHVYPSVYNATLNTSYYGLQPASYKVGPFYLYIASLVFELVCVFAHLYMIFYLGYSTCCCTRACRENCELSSIFQVPYYEDSKYYDQITRNYNRYRWVEYSVSATTMLLLVLSLWGNNIVVLLVYGAICNVLMIGTGDYLQLFIREYSRACKNQTKCEALESEFKNEQYLSNTQANNEEAAGLRERLVNSVLHSAYQRIADLETDLLDVTGKFAKYTDRQVKTYYYCILVTSVISWTVGIIPWINMFIVIPTLVGAPLVAKIMFAGLVFHFFSFGLIEMYHVYRVIKDKGLRDDVQLWTEFLYVTFSLSSKVTLGITCLFLPVP